MQFEAELLLVQKSDLRRYDLVTKNYTLLVDRKGVEGAMGMDFHLEQNVVYWTEVTMGKIKRQVLPMTVCFCNFVCVWGCGLMADGNVVGCVAQCSSYSLLYVVWVWELKADSNVVGCVAQCSPYSLLYIGCVWGRGG